MAGKWTKLGTIFRKKEGNGTYIKVTADAELKEGQFLQIFDPRDNEHTSAENKAKIPDFVMFEIFNVE